MFVNSDFSDLLKIFNDNQVRYLVIGGYAVVQYKGKFISREDLIQAKLASGRPQDLIDADLLEGKKKDKMKGKD